MSNPQLKKLEFKYNLCMIPFYILRLPIIVLILLIFLWEYVVRFGDYLEDKIYTIRDKWIDLTEPPQWYPSYKYLKLAQDIKSKLQQERLKKLYRHNIEDDN